jgi:pyruvate dehydrogenase E2 component (dihydrolipoamide acetyltransferase)
MAAEITMPHLSQTTDEVRLVRWIVEEGDSVQMGDSICEVETDKVTMEVESFTAGTILKLHAKPEQIVRAGTVIAVVGAPGEKVEASDRTLSDEDTPKAERNEIKTEEKAPLDTEESVVPSWIKTPDGVAATPIVRNIARKRMIDLTVVGGTGAGGLITKNDLEQYTRSRKEGAFLSAVEEVSLSSNQSAVARNLVKSKAEIPHFYLKTKVFAERLMNLRERMSRDGKRISVYAMLIYAAAKALREFRGLNGYFRDNRVIISDNINVCFAVAVEDELYAPVVRGADKKGIGEIDSEVRSLISKAQKKALEREDISGGTFTVSNLGMYPVDEFYAVINYPQAGILAMGRIGKTAHIDEANAISIRNVTTLTGSFDHRIVNGAKGAAFLARCKKVLEEEIS